MKKSYATNDTGRQVFIGVAAERVAEDHAAGKVLTDPHMPDRLAAAQDAFNTTLNLVTRRESEWRRSKGDQERLGMDLRRAVRDAKAVLPTLPEPSRREEYLSYYGNLYRGMRDHGDKWPFWFVTAGNLIKGEDQAGEAGLPVLPSPYRERLRESYRLMVDLLKARAHAKNMWNWVLAAHRRRRGELDALARDLKAQVQAFLRDQPKAVVASQLRYYGFNAELVRFSDDPPEATNPEDEANDSETDRGSPTEDDSEDPAVSTEEALSAAATSAGVDNRPNQGPNAAADPSVHPSVSRDTEVALAMV